MIRHFISCATACTLVLFLSGCGGSYTALEPGSAAPEIAVAGWIGEPPQLDAQVYVVEAFATW